MSAKKKFKTASGKTARRTSGKAASAASKMLRGSSGKAASAASKVLRDGGGKFTRVKTTKSGEAALAGRAMKTIKAGEPMPHKPARRAPAKAKGAGDVVTIGREKFDAMIDRMEMLEDLAEARAAREEETLPAEAVAAMVAGASPMRVWRKYRGLTQQDIADTCGKSKGYISQVETGAKDGPVELWRTIADTLDVSIDDLV